jgi:hypothetical protein
MKNIFLLTMLCYFGINTINAQDVTITVNATQNKRLISPYIYGRNEGLDKSVQFYKDAGLRFVRVGGNNATTYNWRAKLDVHPDWYNNVYPSDWDVVAQRVMDNSSNNIQSMFTFQLLGRVASSNQHNFNDWAFNQSQYWGGLSQNLAGGGVVNPAGGGAALVDGDINLFTKPWPADSSVAILNDWFGTNGKGYDKKRFVYWSMDNEVDIWSGTHDYAMPTQLSASAFMDRYIELAKKAKAINPNIKLCGPVGTSEWFWYNWANENIWINGKFYPFLEYFIKRLGDEYKATGVKLVDVVDIHNYPWYNSNDAAALQGHRIYYDTTYDYPGYNGIRKINGGWDNSLKKEFVFKRINDWVTEEFGANSGISVGVSEWGTMSSSNPSLESVIYASHLGTFANNGVELFSPWNWSIGMWETLHLFSKNAKEYSVSSVSSLDTIVSAYSSINNNLDSMTVIIVNRDMNAARNVTVNLNGSLITDGSYKTLQLASLPANETFVSESNNALKQGTAMVTNKTLTVSVPSLSTTAIILTMPSQQPICATPNLGNDIVACGQSLPLVLNSHTTTKTNVLYTWYKDNVKISGASSATYSINSFTNIAGTYKVVRDSAGCSKEDEMVITASIPSVNLGNDKDICSETSFTLDAGISGTGYTYVWKQNGNVLSGQTSQTYTANSAATYTCEVSAANCNTVTDNVVITSSMLDIIPDTICKTGITTLEVTTSGGPFEWYDAQSNGTLLHTGAVYKPTISATTNFYVQDPRGVSNIIGPTTENSGNGWYTNTFSNLENQYILTITQSITLESVYADVQSAGSTITINVMNGTTLVYTKNIAVASAGFQELPLNFLLTPGTYTINAIGSTSSLFLQNAGGAYPIKLTGYVSIENAQSWAGSYVGHFYNWKFRIGSACVRTQVRALLDPLYAYCDKNETQNITLTSGWNLISFNVSPTYKQIDSVFKSIIANVTEIKTFDGFWEKGQIAAFNSLTSISDGGAYFVFLTAPATLTVYGKPVSFPLNLKSGWNLVGCQYQQNTTFSNDFNATNCLMIKNFDGFWIPNGTTNSIQNFEPGKGYFLKGK